MSEIDPITQNPNLATVTVLSNGTVVARGAQVLFMMIERNMSVIPSARLVVFDGDAARSGFEISERDVLNPGAEIEIKADCQGKETSLFKGLLVRHGVKARKDKPALLHLDCRDSAIKLAMASKSAFFYGKTDSDIAAELAGSKGLNTEIDTTPVAHKEVAQSRCSDWDFLVARLGHNGLPVWVNDGTVVATAPDLGQEPASTLMYGGNILEFEAETLAETGWADLQSLSPGDARTKGEPEDKTDTEMLRERLRRIRGRVSCLGFDVKPGQLLELKGVGQRFEGNVFVSGVRHEISNGKWTTQAQFGMAPARSRQSLASPSGMAMAYDDESNAITVNTAGGNSFRLTEQDGTVTVEDQNANKVQLSAGGISLESPADIVVHAGGDIKLNGTNIELSASASFKAEGGTGAEMTTSAIAVVRGSLVHIN